MIKTFLDVPLSSHFSIHNIPFGVCTLPELGAVSPRVCSAIGNFVVDLQAVSENGLWSNPTVDYSDVFKSVCNLHIYIWCNTVILFRIL